MAGNGWKWSEIIRKSQKWSKIWVVRDGHRCLGVVGQKWSEMVGNDQKWSEMVRNSQKWSKMDLMVTRG